MEETNKLLQQLLGKTLAMSDNDIAVIVFEPDGTPKPDALKNLLALDAKRVEALKSKQADGFKSGYSTAMKEVMSKFEDNFKTKYKFDSDLQGEELIDDFVQKQLKGKEVTDEQVKGHSAYKGLQVAHQRDVEKISKEWQDKLTSRETEIKREKVLAKVIDSSMPLLEKLKPVLPAGEKQRSNLLGVFKERLTKRNWDLKSGADGIDVLIPLDPQGQRLENENAIPVTHSDVVRMEAENLFEFGQNGRATHDIHLQNGDGGGTGGVDGNKPSWANKIKLRKPASEMEFAQISKEIYGHKELTKPEKDEAVAKLYRVYTGKEQLAET